MIFKYLIYYIYRLYLYSFLSIHGFILALTIILFSLIKLKSSSHLELDLNNNLDFTLSGISILLAFFVLILQGIKFEKINKKFNADIVVKRPMQKVDSLFKSSRIIKNTIFSLILSSIICLLLLLIFLFLKFNYKDYIIVFISMLIVNYITVGIIFSTIFWSISITEYDN